MTLRTNLVHLAWDPVSGSANYEIQLDGVKVATAGPRAKTTKITIPEGAEHRVTIKALPSGNVQEAKFEWSSVVVAPPPPPPPVIPPFGYTDAALVDTSRDPIAPQGGTTVSLSSPLVLSGSVADITYNVTATMTTAVTVPGGITMERCVVNCNGLAQNGVTGAGTVKDVLVTGAALYGFSAVSRFEGCVKSTRCYRGFNVTGSGVTAPSDCMMKSDDDDHFGFLVIDLSSANIAGAMVALNGGKTMLGGADGASTGIEFWSNVQNSTFNIMISNANPGYGVAIYGSSANNTIADIRCLALGAGGDPALSIGGGANYNTINKLYSDGYTVGVIMGEDVSPSPHHNRVKTLTTKNSDYPGIILDRGAYSNVIGETGGATVTNHGTALTYQGAVHIANRSGQTETPPYSNQVLGLVQSGSTIVPEYALHLGSGTTGNIVTGAASSWSVAKTLDEGSGNSVSI